MIAITRIEVCDGIAADPIGGDVETGALAGGMKHIAARSAHHGVVPGAAEHFVIAVAGGDGIAPAKISRNHVFADAGNDGVCTATQPDAELFEIGEGATVGGDPAIAVDRERGAGKARIIDRQRIETAAPVQRDRCPGSERSGVQKHDIVIIGQDDLQALHLAELVIGQ